MEREYVSPDTAAAYLNKMDKQRGLSTHHVATLANDMKDGRWAEDISAVVFDQNGNLVNGQHRMAAVVRSGIGQYFWVRRGVTPDAILRMDQGRARGAGDQLKIQGVSNANQIAAAARLIIALDRIPDKSWGSMISGAVSRSEVVDHVMNHEQQWQQAAPYMSRIPIKGSGSGRPYSAFVYHVQRASGNAFRLDDYHTGLVTGANLEVGDPRLVLRNYLGRDNLAEWGHGQSHFIVHVQMWNAYIEGREISRIVTPTVSALESRTPRQLYAPL